MRPEIQRVVDLVHRLEKLLKERERLVGDIDREIAAVEAQIDSGRTAVGTAPRTGPFAGAIPKVKPGTIAEKALQIKTANPNVSTAALVMELYGTDDRRSRHALLNVVSNLKKTHRWPWPTTSNDEEVDAA